VSCGVIFWQSSLKGKSRPKFLKNKNDTSGKKSAPKVEPLTEQPFICPFN
jgi:hypothetical protein